MNYSKAHSQPLRFFVLFCCVVMGCMTTDISYSQGADQVEESQEHRIAYTVTFHGLEEDEKLADLMKELSVTVQRQHEPPGSRFLLMKRTNDDQQLLTDALRSQGYFDGVVTVEIVGEQSPYEVIFRIDPQSQYHFAEPVVRTEPIHARFTPPSWEKLGLVPNTPALTADIVKAEDGLIQSAQEEGYPKAKSSKRRLTRDVAKHLVMVEYLLELGPRVQIGAVRIEGSGTVDVDFLKRRIPWQPGVWFHPKRLEEARLAFSATGLFSMVRLQLAKEPDAQGFWPLDVALKERKHRTWRAGAGFSTDRGARPPAGWEHRSFRDAGERLRTDANLGVDSLAWNSSYDIPDFLLRGQKLRFSGKFDKSNEEAFENLSMELGSGVVRPVFEPGGELSLTLNYRLSKVLEWSTGMEKTYSLASLPLGFTLDRSNDPLNPTEGWRISTEIAPFQAITGKSVTYLRLNNHGSFYYPWSDSPGLVLAGRAELDVIKGADRDDIPADTRLYAGGGGSVRGYGHQLASPLDPYGKPLGGRSLLALSSELRYQLNDTFGLVGFVDGGRAFAMTFPEADLNLCYGAGVGIRYMTPIGPLRLDLASPLDKREEIDAAVQFYVSIGQAF